MITIFLLHVLYTPTIVISHSHNSFPGSAFDPLGDPALTQEQKDKVIGLLAEMWGEQINGGSVEQRIFPRALSVAERAWTAAMHFHPSGIWDNAFYGEVEGRLNQMSCTLNRRGIRSSPSAPGHCLWSQVA